MWKFLLTAFSAYCVLCVTPAFAGTSNSVADLQKHHGLAYPNQKLFDDANHPGPRSRNTSESTVLSPDHHSGKTSSGVRGSVEMKAPPQQAVEAQAGTYAGNPPTSTLAGLTELKYPMQLLSHFGPPSQYEYAYLFKYTMPPMVTSLDVGKCFGSQAAAEAAFTKAPMTYGIPLTDSADYINKVTSNAKLVDQLTSPSRWIKTAEVMAQAQQQDMSNSAAQAAEVAFAGAVLEIRGNLFNVANEAGAVKPNIKSATRTVEEVAWMVQEAYKRLFLPMALLLVLPGAVLTQVHSMVGQGFRLKTNYGSAIPGLLRAMIAIFLIPATQLIISYSIDVGNSMTQVICSYGIDPVAIMTYTDAQLYDVPDINSANQLTPQWENLVGRNPALEDKVVVEPGSFWSSILSFFGNLPKMFISFLGIGGADGAAPSGAPSLGNLTGQPSTGSSTGTSQFGGRAAAVPGADAQPEVQSRMSTQMQLAFNTINMLDCSIVSILLQFQTMMMCYLMLLGPIAAAFYAWPQTAPFKNAFASWVDGVVTLSLWRFWWCMILLCMNVRIFWLNDIGQYHINSPFEMIVFSAFTMLMGAVPFQPFDFRPGRFVQQVMDKAEKESQQKAQNMVKGGGRPGYATIGSDGERPKGSSMASTQAAPQQTSNTGSNNDGASNGQKAPPQTGNYENHGAPREDKGQGATPSTSQAGTKPGPTTRPSSQPPPLSGK